MSGKEKCRILRQIRQQIAQENDIQLVTEECSFKGECRGTCPRCEAELQYLEAQLEKRRSRNKKIALAGISAGLVITMTGCSAVNRILDDHFRTTGVMPPVGEEILMGEIVYDDTPEVSLPIPERYASGAEDQ